MGHPHADTGGADGSAASDSRGSGPTVAMAGPADVVFDFSEMEEMRVQDLTVLLTARQLVEDDDRRVWAAGMADRTWHALFAMGLGGVFRPFPVSEDEFV